MKKVAGFQSFCCLPRFEEIGLLLRSLIAFGIIDRHREGWNTRGVIEWVLIYSL